MANAGSNDTIQLPVNTYTLNASGSKDPDGTITAYRWQEISGPNTASSSSMNSAVASLSNLQAGVYQFQLTVTDNSGISSTAAKQLTVLTAAVTHDLLTITDKLSVYPNPAHDVTTLKITSQVTGTVKITVYDMYTVQVTIGNKKTMSTRFIKN